MIHFRSVCISAHLDPLCRAFDRLARGAFLFVFQTNDQGAMRRKIGWSLITSYKAVLDSPVLREEAKNVDVLVTGIKEPSLFESRVNAERTTVYSAERWFKPRRVLGIPVSGIFKLLSVRYLHEALRIANLLSTPYFHAMPIGVHAVRDMARIAGIRHGKLSYLFSAPELVFEACAGGRVLTCEEARSHNLLQEEEEQSLRTNGFVVIPREKWPKEIRSQCKVLGLPNMRLGGYYVPVAGHDGTVSPKRTDGYRLLWVGRYLKCKCVPVVINAFRKVLASRSDASLLLVGEGEDRERCLRMAGENAILRDEPEWMPGKIVFTPFVHNDKVHELMREATLYVMSSNAIEGWGAVVSEAILEGCPVVSSIEVGSSATMLPPGRLFHAGDADALARLIMKFNGDDAGVIIEDWSGEVAAEKIMSFVNERRANEGH